ncbi:MAG: hypothetical protein ABW174_02075 [Flavitalea sp.]
MAEKIFDIRFDYNGMHYNGWVNPSSKKQNGIPTSFHVVLNDIFFGNVSNGSGNWTNSEDRPEELTRLVGVSIDEYLGTIKE